MDFCSVFRRDSILYFWDFLYLFILCMCTCSRVPRCACGNQRTTWTVGLSPPPTLYETGSRLCLLLHSVLQASWPQASGGLSCLQFLSPHRSAGITDTYAGLAFTWVPGNRTEVFRVAQQVLYCWATSRALCTYFLMYRLCLVFSSRIMLAL